MNFQKILVASDFHDSMLALERMLELATEHGVNKIILLGDIFGAHSSEMVERLNTVAYKLTVVKGNNDGFADELPNKDFKVFDQTYEDINGKLAYLCHGHRLSWGRLKMYAAKIIMIGHLHVPILRHEEGVVLLCPGSMARPRSGAAKTFALIDDKKIQILTDQNELVLEMNFDEV